MKIEQPTGEQRRELLRRFAANYGLGDLSSLTDADIATFHELVSSTIDYANEQSDKAPPKELNISRLAHMMEAGFEMELTWEEIATTVAEQYNAIAAPPEPWKPVEGMLYRSWSHTQNMPVRTGWFCREHDKGSFEFEFEGSSWEYPHCAIIDSLDEIGKPPSYFIKRDERHI